MKKCTSCRFIYNRIIARYTILMYIGIAWKYLTGGVTLQHK